ncbi:MAG: prepilin-type N-terminal cleavage/methylation domain [Chthonomonadaceae bacterium]|nr:prepilin-type N-terminal cleavage/methylation domain [Chthonomonadaceae bacterium]
MRRLKAFTLIELLVVIAIIAILAAILFPVFAQAREKARQITCVSNQKQILLALNQYLQDYDEMLPLGRIRPYKFDGNINSTDQVTSIENELDPYIKVGVPWGPARYGTVWNCPDDHLQRDDCDGAPGIGVGYITSYAFTIFNPDFPNARFGLIARNSNADFNDSKGNFINSKQLSEIGMPADTAAILEFYGADAGYSRFGVALRSNNGDFGNPGWTDFPQTLGIGDLCGDGFNWQYTMGSHNGVMNCGFMDGHVKGVRRRTLMNAPGGVWDGKSPNRLHWDENYHK